jgi:hypothetical protein
MLFERLMVRCVFLLVGHHQTVELRRGDLLKTQRRLCDLLSIQGRASGRPFLFPPLVKIANLFPGRAIVRLLLQLWLIYYLPMAKRAQGERKSQIYPLTTPKQRLMIWEKARGVWKGRSPDPIRELRKMRREWSRKPLSVD